MCSWTLNNKNMGCYSLKIYGKRLSREGCCDDVWIKPNQPWVFRPIKREGEGFQTNAKTNPNSNPHAFQTNGKCALTKKNTQTKNTQPKTELSSGYPKSIMIQLFKHGKAIQLHFLWQDWVFVGMRMLHINYSQTPTTDIRKERWYGEISVATIPSEFCQICCQTVATTSATFLKNMHKKNICPGQEFLTPPPFFGATKASV